LKSENLSKYFFIYFFPFSDFRPLQKFSHLKFFNMEVITFESQAFRDLTAKINTIAKFVAAMQTKADEEPTDGWVDSYDVCTFLKISPRTLQRLRASGSVTFSRIRGKVFFRVSEIKHLMDNNIIRRSDEHFQDLIKNLQLHAEQRRNTKTDR
jgi:hypothetical protein